MGSNTYLRHVLSLNAKLAAGCAIALGNGELTDGSKHFNYAFLCQRCMPTRRVERLLPRLSLEPAQVVRTTASRPFRP